MHTEFDIPQENILEIIDEARTTLTVPLKEERTRYDIDMGRAIGVDSESKSV